MSRVSPKEELDEDSLNGSTGSFEGGLGETEPNNLKRLLPIGPHHKSAKLRASLFLSAPRARSMLI